MKIISYSLLQLVQLIIDHEIQISKDLVKNYINRSTTAKISEQPLKLVNNWFICILNQFDKKKILKKINNCEKKVLYLLIPNI